jgi:hypothetical protein
MKKIICVREGNKLICVREEHYIVNDEYYKICTSCKIYIRVKRFRDDRNVIRKMCIKCRSSQQRYAKAMLQNKKIKMTRMNKIYVPQLPLSFYI